MNAHRAIVALLALIALTALTGCLAGIFERLRVGEIAGTWRGEFYQVGGDAMLEGQMTLDIKQDGTYELVAKRSGGGSVTETGTVTMRGQSVTLKSDSGYWTPLSRSGDTLYGLTTHTTGRPIKIFIERKRGGHDDGGADSAPPLSIQSTSRA
ncbi:MAG TPA: hypothetical protein VJX91_00375 [Candidatus Eisenbacteria bacterium]|nr:hypothetical protein [Candidatus Eisenbacteria bacterium]